MSDYCGSVDNEIPSRLEECSHNVIRSVLCGRRRAGVTYHFRWREWVSESRKVVMRVAQTHRSEAPLSAKMWWLPTSFSSWPKIENNLLKEFVLNMTNLDRAKKIAAD